MSDKTPTKETVVLVDRSKLLALNARPGFRDYLVELWDRRHFIVADARTKAFQSTRNTFLGRIWIIVQPLLDIAIYALIFGLILKTSRGIDNFLGFLTLGVIFFGFFSGGFLGGTRLIQSSKSLIGSFSFPKASLPIAKTLRQLIDNLVPATLAVVFAFLFQWPNGPTWHLVLLPGIYLMLHLTMLGLTLIVARLTAFIPDLAALVSLLSRALFFASGVFFTLDRFSGSPHLQKVISANPGYLYLQAIRDVTIYHQLPTMTTWIQLALWSFGLASVGLLFFWQAEERYPSVR
ncbi:ABC transporter permease [Corynebacterium phocae]|uniref:Transport permease protein n=1 Tax=Corynebacterium phocae TaxID=161895 RepID=A0A1L7D679_9CORY|nr:ABC transporter permease [Corynebacterium phocae]